LKQKNEINILLLSALQWHSQGLRSWNPNPSHQNLLIMFLRTLSSSLALLNVAQALSPSGWRAQSIYQVMTDRFARTDGSTTASCDLGNYCGGSWQGLINHLDYIQNMGFTAVGMRVFYLDKY
jgi:hypothetical protein